LTLFFDDVISFIGTSDTLSEVKEEKEVLKTKQKKKGLSPSRHKKPQPFSMRSLRSQAPGEGERRRQYVRKDGQTQAQQGRRQ